MATRSEEVVERERVEIEEDDLQKDVGDLQVRPARFSPADAWLSRSVLEAKRPTGELQPMVPHARTVTRPAMKKIAATIAPEEAPAPVSDERLIEELLIEDQIRVVAYQLFEQRGYEHGYDVEDWKRAEEIVLSRMRGEQTAA